LNQSKSCALEVGVVVMAEPVKSPAALEVVVVLAEPVRSRIILILSIIVQELSMHALSSLNYE
jgi:hypothetical protein